MEITIGKEEHKFQEGPFSCFGEQMLEQAMMIPSSPFINSTNHQVVENNAKNTVSNNLRKINTQPHISSLDNKDINISSRKQQSSDILPLNKQTWTPDYSLRAVTDCVYLKIRKNTYLSLIKASRMNNMNSEMDGTYMKEQELEDYLKKITENDGEFTGKHINKRM